MTDSVLVIGLGSMGKRRIRNLQAIGVKNIVGIDPRNDRRAEAEEKYGVTTFSNINDAIEKKQFDAFVISVPPDIHHIYMRKALELNVPAFVEASVVDTDMESIKNEAADKKILIAPSCTLFFHPAIKKISEIVNSGELGKISNFLYQTGQYLPDWHTYEDVSEFYVSNKATGGAREIVPFELTWITMLWGMPERIMGLNKKTIDIKGAEQIDDTYSLLLDYKDKIVNLTIDVVSRYATRKLVINGDKKQLSWHWDDNEVKIFDPENNAWKSVKYELTPAEQGYNKNITEQMYIDELSLFLNAAKGTGRFPNTLEKDHDVLKLLYAAEKANETNTIITIKK
ncbi:MAG TPA: Gfo/Idh/MocA family oxidoreductase [Chitinophagales bacterium]|nr:Gfo/Idh/MocA family oxidoreductase [Chitinophagales bacterium]